MNNFQRLFNSGVFALLGSVVFLSVVLPIHAEPKNVAIKETAMGNLDEIDRRSLKYVTISPDYSRIAYMYVGADEQAGQSRRLVLDGAKVPTPDGNINFICFSPDSKRVAYIGWKGFNENAVPIVFVDGKTLATYPKGVYVNDLRFSPDSTRVLWTVDRGKGPIIFDGGKELTGFPVAASSWAERVDEEAGEYSPQAFVFAPNGKSLAYAKQLDSRVLWMVNGKPVATPGELLDVAWLVFSPDSNRFAVGVGTYDQVVNRGSSIRTMFVDGKAGKAFSDLGRPVFSSDSKHVAFRATITDPRTGEHNSVVVLDGVESERWNKVAELCFTSDGSTLVYRAWRNTGDDLRRFVVVGGNSSSPYEEVRDILISPVGKRVAFVGKKTTEKEAVVLDGKEIGEYASVAEGSLVFSPDGQHIAYRAELNGNVDLFIDGKQEQAKGSGTQPVFSPKGTVVLLDSSRVIFSPDGNHQVEYGCTVPGSWLLTVDGKVIASYDTMDSSNTIWHKVRPRFITPNTFRILALKDKKLLLVEVLIPEP